MEEFMEEFMHEMSVVFPNLIVQFEDFSTDKVRSCSIVFDLQLTGVLRIGVCLPFLLQGSVSALQR